MEPNDQLFTGRTDNYARFRPSYPKSILKMLEERYGFRSTMTVADIGCGTGILSRVFLDNGNQVYCVDPNDEMLATAKRELYQYDKAVIINGLAERTGLKDKSINIIVAGQAFHWFNADCAKVEFKRILTDPFLVALIWNDRDNRYGFTSEYERIVSIYSKNYRGTGSTAIPIDIITRFFEMSYDYYEYKNSQELDLEGVKGRYLSNSYSLNVTDKRFPEAINALNKAFEKYNIKGKVSIEYITKIFIGKLV